MNIYSFCWLSRFSNFHNVFAPVNHSNLACLECTLAIVQVCGSPSDNDAVWQHAGPSTHGLVGLLTANVDRQRHRRCQPDPGGCHTHMNGMISKTYTSHNQCELSMLPLQKVEAFKKWKHVGVYHSTVSSIDITVIKHSFRQHLRHLSKKLSVLVRLHRCNRIILLCRNLRGAMVSLENDSWRMVGSCDEFTASLVSYNERRNMDRLNKWATRSSEPGVLVSACLNCFIYSP